MRPSPNNAVEATGYRRLIAAVLVIYLYEVFKQEAAGDSHAPSHTPMGARG